MTQKNTTTFCLFTYNKLHWSFLNFYFLLNPFDVIR